MDREFIKAFTEVIREQITQNKEIKLNGVGIFRPGHRKQFQQQQKDGRVVMMPPKDEIEFIPEKKNGNG